MEDVKEQCSANGTLRRKCSRSDCETMAHFREWKGWEWCWRHILPAVWDNGFGPEFYHWPAKIRRFIWSLSGVRTVRQPRAALSKALGGQKQ